MKCYFPQEISGNFIERNLHDFTCITYILPASPTFYLRHLRFTYITYILPASPTFYLRHLRFTCVTYVLPASPTFYLHHLRFTCITYILPVSPTRQFEKHFLGLCVLMAVV